MSQTATANFEMMYKIEFTCGIREHHVYKSTWTPVLNEKLNCKKDNHEETLKLQQAFSRSFQKGWNPCWSYNF